jgi:hypothetical protein
VLALLRACDVIVLLLCCCADHTKGGLVGGAEKQSVAAMGSEVHTASGHPAGARSGSGSGSVSASSDGSSGGIRPEALAQASAMGGRRSAKGMSTLAMTQLLT